MKIRIVCLLILLIPGFAFAQDAPAAPAIKSEILGQSTDSWDGTPYKAYPAGQPQLTVVKITIPPHTTMKWHSHPIPNAGYILSGEITVETKEGATRHFRAGQVVPETVNTVHRGVTGAEPAVIIVFYAGAPGRPLSEAQ
jgi:quercetin dioxygenase-like cupin family protein